MSDATQFKHLDIDWGIVKQLPSKPRSSYTSYMIDTNLIKGKAGETVSCGAAIGLDFFAERVRIAEYDNEGNIQTPLSSTVKLVFDEHLIFDGAARNLHNLNLDHFPKVNASKSSSEPSIKMLVTFAKDGRFIATFFGRLDL